MIRRSLLLVEYLLFLEHGVGVAEIGPNLALYFYVLVPRPYDHRVALAFLRPPLSVFLGSGGLLLGLGQGGGLVGLFHHPSLVRRWHV